MLPASRSDRRAAAALQPIQILYWIYAGRLVFCLAVYGSGALVGDYLQSQAPGLIAPETRLLGILGLTAAAFLTPLAYWHSHHHRRRPSRRFLYSQAVLDVLLATGIVHITGGSRSPFVSLLIAVAAAYALILPLLPAVMVALAAGSAHLVDNLLAYPGQVGSVALLLQVAVITLVALATSLIGGRLGEVRRELRTVEGELRRLRLDTADVLRTIPSGVVTLDSEGRLAYMNLAAAELLDLDVQEVLGSDVMPQLKQRAPEVAAAVRETLAASRRITGREGEIVPRADRSVSGTGATEDPGAAPIPVSVSTTVLQDAGAGPSHVVLLQDLRATRQLEDLRLRTGKLEAVAELSASLAHELRNPLASIRSAVEQLSARAREDEDDQVLGRLIVRESDRLGKILGEFSDFARISVAERRPVDVEKLVREVLETARQHPAAERRATFEVEILDGVEGLWGDGELLHRTLLNLVLNAVQVGAESKPVHVRVVVDALRPDLIPGEVSLGDPVRIRIIDDGPGIAPVDLPRIFDPFYTRREGGSGLGLSIAHRAVQAHGGALVASSSPGEGATFVVVLPRRARPGLPPAYGERRSTDADQPSVPARTSADTERATSKAAAREPVTASDVNRRAKR